MDGLEAGCVGSSAFVCCMFSQHCVVSSVATHYLTVVAYQCLPVLPVDLELLHSHAGGCQEGQEQIRMGAGAVQW